jgi:hypothetical protein
MPIYEYKNPKTGETVEVIQGMKDKHIFVDDQGVKWERVWVSPNTSVDTVLDPFNKEKYLDKTRKSQSLGEMWDHAAELSEKRAHLAGGEDPVKKEYLKEYSEKRRGKTHPSVNKDKTIEIDFNKLSK